MKNLHRILMYTLCSLIITGSNIIITNVIIVNAEEKIHSNNVDLIILFDENLIDKNVINFISESGGIVSKEFYELSGIEVKCSSALIPQLASKSSIKSIAPNHTIELSEKENNKNNVSSNSYDNFMDVDQWDIKRVTNNGESYSLESGNHNVVIGIIDSGVDTTHPDLINNFLGGKNLVPAKFNNNSDESGDINDVTDRLGHGTNVTGIIAANGKIKEVAPNIGFKSYRIFHRKGKTNPAICSEAIMMATHDGVNVINLSISSYNLKGKFYYIHPNTSIKYKLGDDMGEYTLLKRAIKYTIKNGVTIVSASRNDSNDCENKKELTNYLNGLYNQSGFFYEGLTYESPGTIKGVITVAATDKHDNITSYSNYRKGFIDISAPGGEFSDKYKENGMCFTTNINSNYTFNEGTSFAAPKVSAVAVLIICQNSNLSPLKIAKKIYKSSDKIANNKSNNFYGVGIINAYNALK
ncbi:MAG: S8 family serine peptidase [Clostridium butyricum]